MARGISNSRDGAGLSFAAHAPSGETNGGLLRTTSLLLEFQTRRGASIYAGACFSSLISAVLLPATRLLPTSTWEKTIEKTGGAAGRDPAGMVAANPSDPTRIWSCEGALMDSGVCI